MTGWVREGRKDARISRRSRKAKVKDTDRQTGRKKNQFAQW